MKIAIRFPNWVGDIIMSIPAIRRLKRENPESKISVICRENLKDLFKFIKEVDEIIPLRKRGNIWKNLREKNFDIYISFPNSLSSGILGFVSKIPRRIGYKKDLRCPLFTVCIPRDEKILNEHHIFYYLHLLEKAKLIKHSGVEIEFSNINELKNAKNKAREKFFKNSKNIKIGIHPGAAYGRTKMWPEEKFIELIKLIRGKVDAEIFLIGNRREIEISNRIVNESEGVEILTGKTTLYELVGVISNFDIFISNDSGPMHISAALSKHQIAIFGSTDPVITSPWNKNAEILKGITHCSPCFLKECPFNLECMEKVSVEEVFQKIQKMLNKISKGARHNF